MNVRQAEVAPLEAVGEFRVVEAEQVQESGVQISGQCEVTAVGAPSVGLPQED